MRNKSEVIVGQFRTHKRDGKIKHKCPLASFFKMKMLTKNTILLHFRVTIWKIFSIILRRIWKYRMHMSIDVKCLTWSKIARSFRFVSRFLYVLCLFSSVTHLLAPSPYCEMALMTSYTLYNKKVFNSPKDGLLGYTTHFHSCNW